MNSMRHLLFLILLGIGTTLSAQITFETSFATPDQIGIAPLENSGPKLAVFNSQTHVLKLYNGNHSLFRTIAIDVSSLINTSLYPNVEGSSLFNIREGLFDNDAGVEGLYYTVRYDQNYNDFKEFIMVFDNDGSILWSAENEAPAYQDDYAIFTIYNADGTDAKLLTLDSNTDDLKVYDLPGTWSCDPCNGGATAVAGSMDGQRVSMDNFPNPASDYTEIRYELPAKVKNAEILIFDTHGTLLKTFQVDHSFDSLQLSTQDFAAGTYYYALQTAAGDRLTKKMLVIR